jgi:hypothetical protein
MEIQKNYLLKDFQSILFNGFSFELPEETLKLINELASEVGSPSYIKTPVFQKRENVVPLSKPSSKDDFTKMIYGPGSSSSLNSRGFQGQGQGYGDSNTYKKKRRGGKLVETVNEEDWETIRTFHTTKMEEKTGSEAQFDVIRSYLNKLTDKNVDDMTTKIITIIETLKKGEEIHTLLSVLYKQIFENAFHNRFYSRIYTLLYSKLLEKYKSVTDKNSHIRGLIEKIQSSIDSIEFVDSSEDYDKFCKINKENEKRKAMCEFLMNFIREKIVDEEVGTQLLTQLFDSLLEWITLENKKNEVDEISELIAILWKKGFYSKDVFLEKVQLIAHSKTKDYLSLTNKTIFKFMDMNDL